MASKRITLYDVNCVWEREREEIYFPTHRNVYMWWWKVGMMHERKQCFHKRLHLSILSVNGILEKSSILFMNHSSLKIEGQLCGFSISVCCFYSWCVIVNLNAQLSIHKSLLKNVYHNFNARTLSHVISMMLFLHVHYKLFFLVHVALNP